MEENKRPSCLSGCILPTLQLCGCEASLNLPKDERKHIILAEYVLLTLGGA